MWSDRLPKYSVAGVALSDDGLTEAANRGHRHQRRAIGRGERSLATHTRAGGTNTTRAPGSRDAVDDCSLSKGFKGVSFHSLDFQTWHVDKA